MKQYLDRFNTILEAEEEVTDKEAFTATLDPGTDPGEFDSATNPQIPEGPSKEEVVRDQQISTLQGWVTKVTEFISFLNGLESDSVQKQLNDAECDTLFNDIARGETKRIARLAQDLSGLNESFKGYLLANDED